MCTIVYGSTVSLDKDSAATLADPVGKNTLEFIRGLFHDHFAEWSEEVGAVSLGRSSRLAYIFFGPIDRISVQLQSKTDHFPGGFW